MSQVKAVKGTSTFGVKFAVCGNSEYLGLDSSGTGLLAGEAELLVCDAAGRVIEAAGYDFRVDSVFRHWAGGEHSQFATLFGRVAAYVYVRDEDDESWDAWQPATAKNIPGHVLGEISRVQADAEAALWAEVERINSMRDAE